MPIWIEDPDDPRVADFLHLTDVRLRRRVDCERGLFLAESDKVIRRALAAGHRARAYLMAPRWAQGLADLVTAAEAQGVPVYLATDPVIRAMTGFHLHRGAIASMYRPELPALAQVLAGARRVIVLEDIVDHTNVGASFRSAAGCGMDAILVTPDVRTPYYRRSVRVSMGTVFQLPWTQTGPWPAGVADLRAAGFTVAALALTADAISLDRLAADLPPRLALILGTEGDGLAAGTLAAADLTVRIPMAAGVDSLNVAAACAVAAWAVREPAFD